MYSLKRTFIVLLLLPLLISCTKSEQIKIGFLIPASVGYRWVIDQDYVEQFSEEKGAIVYSRSAENDENLQLKQADELLELGIDVLIVVPSNTNTAAAIVRKAHDYGVPVIGYDRLIKNSDLDYLVSFEGAKIGSLMIEHALQIVPKGNYVMLWGDPSDDNAILIKNEQERMLQPYIDKGEITIVYKTFVENWSKDNASHIMQRVLNFSDEKIDAVITSYDGLAQGVLEAAEVTGIKSFKVLTGQDAEIEAIKSILKGETTMTVYKSIKTIAKASVDLAMDLATNQKVENVKSSIYNGRKDVPTLLLEPVPVTIKNIRSTVIADEFYTEEEVYGK